MSNKRDKHQKGIFGVRKSAKNQFRPFGPYSDPFPSDDSEDSDYEPNQSETKDEDESRKESPSSRPKKRSNNTTIQDKVTPDLQSTSSEERLKNGNRKKKRKTLSKDVQSKPSEHCNALGDYSKAWSDLIPNEVLLQIFTYCVESQGAIPLLSRLSKVCNRWNIMSKEPMLYKKIDLSSVGKYSIASDTLIRQLLGRGVSGAEELSLEGWIKLSDKGLEHVAKTCKNLKSLSLSNCEGLSPKFFNILANEKCSQLSSIDVSGTKIDHGSLRKLLTRYGSNLKEILLRNCKGFPGSVILPMIQELCPNLQHLDLSGILIRQIKIELLQEDCPKLKTLLLANLWPQPSYIYTRNSKTSGVHGFPDLVHLSLACDNQVGIAINDALITRLLKTSSNLRVLDIRGCGRVTVDAIQSLCTTSLESLYIANTGANVAMVTAVLNKWYYSLRHLDLGTNPAIRDDTLAVFERFSLPNLESLDLTCTGVSIKGLGNVLKNCPKLKDLNLSCCRGIPRGLKQRHAGQRLVRLTNQILSGSSCDSDGND